MNYIWLEEPTSKNIPESIKSKNCFVYKIVLLLHGRDILGCFTIRLYSIINIIFIYYI